MKKTTLNMFLAGMLSIVLPCSTMAATNYSLTLGGNVNWDTASWSPAGVPVSGDNATVETADSTARLLYLNGDREVENFIRGSGGGTGGLRIYSGSTTGDSSDTLTVTGTFTAAKEMSFRSKSTNSPLTIRMENFLLTNAARVYAADSADFQRFVDLKVSGTTTFEGGNTAFLISSFATTNDTKLDLGHVYFGSTLSGGSPGIEINGGALQVRSLESATGSTNGTIRGTGGTLLIYGDAPSGTNAFASAVTGGVRVEKTGGNTQIFSGSGYTYSGGTLISGGVLSANNSDSNLTGRSALGTGAVTVANHGTLAGRGSVRLGAGNYITVQEGGTIAPSADGQPGFSTLLLNNSDSGGGTILKMEEGSAFAFKVDDEGNSDLITFGFYTVGDVLFEGGAIALNITGTLAEGHTYELFNFKSGSAQFGALTNSGLTGGLQAGTGFDGYLPTFHYDESGYGGAGIISMTVTPIPEPSTAAVLLLMLPLAAMALVRNKRKSL